MAPRARHARVLALSGDDGVRLAPGNDWGVQVDDGCVRTLGSGAEWRRGEFALIWTGDILRGGIDAR